jgi:hypothetical protein
MIGIAWLEAYFYRVWRSCEMFWIKRLNKGVFRMAASTDPPPFEA